jgi:cysteine synthase A
MTGYAAFVEANTTGTGMKALHRAEALGYRPLFLTADASRYRGLEHTPAEVVVCDTSDAGALAAALRSRPGPGPAGVLTTSEFYIARVAALAAELGLPGNPPEAVRLCRDKAAVRLRLTDLGIGQPRFTVLDHVETVPDAVAAVGLPCVVKPVDDSGSTNVRICTTVEQATLQAKTITAVEYNARGQRTDGRVLIEQYIPGPEFSVETFSVDGTVMPIGVTQRTLTSPPHCVERQHMYPAQLAPEAEQELTAAVGEVLGAVGVRWGPVHTEMKLTAGGPVLIEVNCRLAGGMVPELIRLVDGLDLLDEQIRCAVGERPRLAKSRSGCAGVQFLTAAESGILHGLRGVEAARVLPGVTELSVNAVPGVKVRPPRSAYDRLGFAVVRASGHEELRQRMSAVAATVVPVVVPD